MSRVPCTAFHAGLTPQSGMREDPVVSCHMAAWAFQHSRETPTESAAPVNCWDSHSQT